MERHMFIATLNKKEKLIFYKKIKRYLVENEVFSYENLKNAMEQKIKDIVACIGEEE